MFVELIDGLSEFIPPSIFKDKLNDFVSGFGAQDSTDIFIVPYKPSEPHRRRDHTALMPRAVPSAVPSS